MNASEAIRKRWSSRAFLDTPVNREDIIDILDTARWAPSGSNLQPWKVAVVTGNTKEKLSQALAEKRAAGSEDSSEFKYYPDQWDEPYTNRRKACGLALYNALDIRREDREKRISAWIANYYFFGAPAGLVFMMDRSMNPGALADIGMFMQSVMLAALEKGFATCPQASIGEFPETVRKVLGLDDSIMVLFGMSLGKPDLSAPVNNYRTERAEVEQFARFYE